jgi:hypothetical protein
VRREGEVEEAGDPEGVVCVVARLDARPPDDGVVEELRRQEHMVGADRAVTSAVRVERLDRACEPRAQADGLSGRQRPLGLDANKEGDQRLERARPSDD